MKSDLCVIGAGAAGMSAAISAAAAGMSVILIEKNKKEGSKLYAAGNGKCNLSNVNMDVQKHYNSGDRSYVQHMQNLYVGEHTAKSLTAGIDNPVNNKLNEFFDSIGLAVYSDAGGYVYPCSNQASSVVWAMKDALEGYGVRTILNAEATEICRSGEDFCISYALKSGETKTAFSKYALLACGGNSYAKLGGSTRGYELARSLGHSVTDIYPALCGLKTDSELHSADGVRVKTTARLLVNDSAVDEAAGEIQITSYGLSGIAIFNLSSRAVRHMKKGEKVEIAMNLLENAVPNYSTEDGLVRRLTDFGNNRTIFGALNGLTNEKLALYALEKQGASPKEKLRGFSTDRLRNIIKELTCYRCTVTGSNDFDTAQVTAGGVKLSEIDMESFESRLVPGLYMAGEMLDVDGICGGYNITFAIMSGITAAESIKEKL